MTWITLSFTPDMARAINEGRKCCTSRREPKCKIGDTFGVDGRTYRIISVNIHTKSWIFCHLYRHEGFSSRSECRAFLNQVYPKLGHCDDLYVHYFAAVQT